MQDKKKAKNCVMPGGMYFRRLPEIEHGFHVPLILNEVGGIFYVPLAQLGGAQRIENILGLRASLTFNRGVMGSSPIWSIAA